MKKKKNVRSFLYNLLENEQNEGLSYASELVMNFPYVNNESEQLIPENYYEGRGYGGRDYGGRGYGGRDYGGRDYGGRGFGGRDYGGRNYGGRDYGGRDFDSRSNSRLSN